MSTPWNSSSTPSKSKFLIESPFSPKLGRFRASAWAFLPLISYQVVPEPGYESGFDASRARIRPFDGITVQAVIPG